MSARSVSLVAAPARRAQGGLAPAGLSASLEEGLRAYFLAHGQDLPAPGLYERVLQEVERPLLLLALEACGGNQLKAAALLGLNRNTLRKKLKLLDLAPLRARRRIKRVL